MSTWISDRARPGRLIPAILFLVAGCDAVPMGGNAPALTDARLAGGEILVSGPPGYCIDPASLRADTAGGFALLASCAALGSEGPSAGLPAVMTVTVSRPVPGQDAPTLADLQATVAPANVLDTVETDTLVMVQLDQGGEAAFDGSDARYWRGMKRVGARIVGLALYAPEGGSLAESGGSDLMARLAAGIRPAAPATDGAVETADQGTGTAEAPQPRPATLGGLFRGLLNPR